MHHLTWDGRDWDLGGRGEGESNIHPREVGGGGKEGRGEGTRERGGRSNAGVKSGSCGDREKIKVNLTLCCGRG